MSFREKSAWITLVALVLVTLLFAAHLPWSRPFTLAPAPNAALFHALVFAVVTFVVIAVAGHSLVALRAPREANARADERERLIGLKATRLSAYVYAFTSLSAIYLIHLGANAIGLAYALVLAFVCAEIVGCVARIVYHRRGVG